MDYFSADFHFGDPRLELLGRPFKSTEEAQEKMLEPLLQMTEDDNFYIVGDVAINEEWLKPISQCKAHKHLFKGNYDRLDDSTYLKYFDSVQDKMTGMISDPDGKLPDLRIHINHYPGRSIPDAFNLVAHIHGCWRVQKNMLNVGVDAHHLRPISSKDVFFYYNGICNFYDQDVWVQEHEANIVHKKRGKEGTYWQRGFGGTLK